MDHTLTDIVFQEEFKKVKLYHTFHFALVLLGVLFHFIHDKIGFLKLIILVPVFLGFYRLHFQMLKKLFYSYWTFSIILLAYFLYSVFANFETSQLFYIYLLATLFLLLELYTISSPIFYPRVNWWEYDFRYRGDISVQVKIDNELVDAKLTDLRRGAGCLVMFREFFTSKKIEINTKMEDLDINLKGEIISSRLTTTGRGIKYGVRFIFESNEERAEFKKFTQIWDRYKKSRRRAKFAK